MIQLDILPQKIRVLRPALSHCIPDERHPLLVDDTGQVMFIGLVHSDKPMVLIGRPICMQVARIVDNYAFDQVILYFLDIILVVVGHDILDLDELLDLYILIFYSNGIVLFK